MKSRMGARSFPQLSVSAACSMTKYPMQKTYELKQVAIAVIRENRNRLQNAHELFEELDRLVAAGSTDEHLAQLRHDYRIAMLNLHAQHQVVSLVVEHLGFVPEVDGQRPVLN